MAFHLTLHLVCLVLLSTSALALPFPRAALGTGKTTTRTWDTKNHLRTVTLPDGGIHSYGYDYRIGRITRTEPSGTTAMTYSGGLSVAEYAVPDATSSIQPQAASVVEYQRGPDMGGGVGGLLYSLRGATAKFNLSNGRGDVVAQSDTTGALTWTASYEAYGKRPVETGTNADRQRANTKEEDPTGLLNEGFRYRDIETGVWLSRDPAGFVDGPNLYAYVRQNPWSKFDPDGLTGWPLDFPNAAPQYTMANKEYRTAYMQSAAKGLAVGAGIAAAVGIAVVAPEAYAYAMANPGTVYVATEVVTTTAEIATGYDGPPIIPGPGDIVRASVQAEKQVVKSIEKTAAQNADEAKKLGGAYENVPANGGEVHHAPADSVSPLSTDKGPGWRMDTPDHRETASWGSSKEAKAYREQQKKLIEEKKFKEAQQMDIDDVRAKFGDKYDEGIRQAQGYTETIDPKKLEPKK